jgi:predicted ATP-dependent serine protease
MSEEAYTCNHCGYKFKTLVGHQCPEAGTCIQPKTRRSASQSREVSDPER